MAKHSSRNRITSDGVAVIHKQLVLVVIKLFLQLFGLIFHTSETNLQFILHQKTNDCLRKCLMVFFRNPGKSLAKIAAIRILCENNSCSLIWSKEIFMSLIHIFQKFASQFFGCKSFHNLCIAPLLCPSRYQRKYKSCTNHIWIIFVINFVSSSLNVLKWLKQSTVIFLHTASTIVEHVQPYPCFSRNFSRFISWTKGNLSVIQSLMYAEKPIIFLYNLAQCNQFLRIAVSTWIVR